VSDTPTHFRKASNPKIVVPEELVEPSTTEFVGEVAIDPPPSTEATGFESVSDGELKLVTMKDRISSYASEVQKKSEDAPKASIDIVAEISSTAETDAPIHITSIKDRIVTLASETTPTPVVPSIDKENDEEIAQARRMSIRDRIKSYRAGGAGSIALTDTEPPPPPVVEAAPAPVLEDVAAAAEPAANESSVVAAGEEQQSVIKVSSASATVAPPVVEREFDKEVVRKTLCVVCHTNVKEVIFIPCGHTCVCSACSKAMVEEGNKACPQCKSVVKMRRLAI
jgi:hypothetical protein